MLRNTTPSEPVALTFIRPTTLTATEATDGEATVTSAFSSVTKALRVFVMLHKYPKEIRSFQILIMQYVETK